MLERLRTLIPEVLCNHRPDCCILASRVALDVLHFFKIPAQPLSVKALIYNEPLVRRMSEGRAPRTTAALEEAFQTDGSYSVGLGYGYTEGKWSGHLVVVSQNEMLDLTIGQACRPQHGIYVEPWVVSVDEEFVKGVQPLLLTRDGSVVKYTAFPHDFLFEKAPDWTNFSWRERLVNQVIRRL